MTSFKNSAFRTVVPIDPCDFKIGASSKIMLIGSCFSQNVGDKFLKAGFDVSINPFGVVYNPSSIATQISRIINNKPYTEDDIHYHNHLFHTFDHHTSFSMLDKDAFLHSINDQLKSANEFLQRADVLIITLGSAFVYRHLNLDQIVANCHKYPAKVFRKDLLTTEEIVYAFNSVFNDLKSFNPTLKIIFTVSPVRHKADGYVKNNLSKSLLILSIHHLLMHHSNLTYFPAYEIVMDELRDYRFYDVDMLHPNQTAIDYVWSRLGDFCFSKEVYLMEKEFLTLVAAFNHRPFNPFSPDHLRFLQEVEEKINAFHKSYSHQPTFKLVKRD